MWASLGSPTPGTSNTVTAVEEERGSIPESMTLLAPYPNPFNSETTIAYQVQQRASVEISVYDLLGRRVSTLFNGEQVAGTHVVTWDASGFTSGVYTIRMIAGGYRSARRVVLVR